jgi:hypothetical protein
MADLKSFWDNPGMPMSTDLGGDAIPSSGSDPNAEGDGGDGNAHNTFWPNPGMPTLTDKSESANSVSGLPALPNRYEPSPQSPPEPPDLKERRPGTIDEK